MVSVQGDVSVAFQGDSGAFSQSAARIFFTDHGADSVALHGFSTFDDVFTAVRDSKVQCVSESKPKQNRNTRSRVYQHS